MKEKAINATKTIVAAGIAIMTIFILSLMVTIAVWTATALLKAITGAYLYFWGLVFGLV